MPKDSIIIAITKAAKAFIFLFIPILQFYSAVIALPLFLLPQINSSSKYIEYSFIYFIVKHPASIILFAVYYLMIFNIIEFIKYNYEKNIDEQTRNKIIKIYKKSINFVLSISVIGLVIVSIIQQSMVLLPMALIVLLILVKFNNESKANKQ